MFQASIFNQFLANSTVVFIKVKVKLSPSLTKHHAVKEYGRVEV
jgi:hypothetical protein